MAGQPIGAAYEPGHGEPRHGESLYGEPVYSEPVYAEPAYASPDAFSVGHQPANAWDEPVAGYSGYADGARTLASDGYWDGHSQPAATAYGMPDPAQHPNFAGYSEQQGYQQSHTGHAAYPATQGQPDLSHLGHQTGSATATVTAGGRLASLGLTDNGLDEFDLDEFSPGETSRGRLGLDGQHLQHGQHAGPHLIPSQVGPAGDVDAAASHPLPSYPEMAYPGTGQFGLADQGYPPAQPGYPDAGDQTGYGERADYAQAQRQQTYGEHDLASGDSWGHQPQHAHPTPDYQLAEPGHVAQQAEPAYAEHFYSQAGYAGPAYTEPTYTEPTYTESAYTEPAYVEPAYVEPTYVEPVYTQAEPYPSAGFEYPPARTEVFAPAGLTADPTALGEARQAESGHESEQEQDWAPDWETDWETEAGGEHAPAPDPSPDELAPLADAHAVAALDAARAPARTPGPDRSRTPRPRRSRSSVMSVVGPPAAVVGAAAVAVAVVGGLSMPDAKGMTNASGEAKNTSSPLNDQISALREEASAVATRASRDQERVSLAQQQAQALAAARQHAEEIRPKFLLPIQDDYELTAGFGQAGDHWMSLHTGQDFAVPTGTPVHAVTDGTVTEAGWLGPYGYAVVITAKDGTQTWYCHLSQIKVRSGPVKAGEKIALAGATGNVTGPHLHFEVRIGGTPVDPMPWLRQHGLNP